VEKRIKIDCCEEILYILPERLPAYEANTKELYELALKAGYTEERARKEFYLKILPEEE
jgi:hypothetical protein